MAVLESFLRSRGNLRDMERELSLSYPTVRARVEALIRALGFGPRADSDEAVADAASAAADLAAAGADISAARQEILERLAKRDITAEDAAAAIRNLARSR